MLLSFYHLLKPMKITLLTLLNLFALCTKPILFGGFDSSLDKVVDTSGNKLRAGSNYYILPVPPTKCTSFGTCTCGSGFVLAKISNKTCPLDVVAVNGFHGQPLSFTPIKPEKKDFVHVSTDLNIKFSVQTICPQSTVWKIDHFDRSTRKWFVTTGGDVGNPTWKTIYNWFKIEKYENDYKLVYCPSYCEYCRVQCRDIGVYEDQIGNKRLALTDVPYKVRFQKA